MYYLVVCCLCVWFSFNIDFTVFLCFCCRQEEVIKVRKYQQDLRQRGLEKVNIVYLFVIAIYACEVL